MSDLEVGDIIKDNDPRMPGRKLEIVHFGQDDRLRIMALCNTVGSNPRGHWIRINRIFTDGKPRRYGFSRLPNP
jgi:hypothetical protein